MPLAQRPFVSFWCSVVRGRSVLRCISQLSGAACALPVFLSSALFDLPSPRPRQTGSNDEASQPWPSSFVLHEPVFEDDDDDDDGYL